MVTPHVCNRIADQLILSGIAQVQRLSSQGNLFSQQTVDCQKRNGLISSFTNRPVLKRKTNFIRGTIRRKFFPIHRIAKFFCVFFCYGVYS